MPQLAYEIAPIDYLINRSSNPEVEGRYTVAVISITYPQYTKIKHSHYNRWHRLHKGTTKEAVKMGLKKT